MQNSSRPGWVGVGSDPEPFVFEWSSLVGAQTLVRTYEELCRAPILIRPRKRFPFALKRTINYASCKGATSQKTGFLQRSQ